MCLIVFFTYFYKNPQAMPQSFDRIIVHTIFGTKYRQPFIDEEIEPELHNILSAELQKHGCKVIIINGTKDHVHLLHSIPRTKTIAQIVQSAKSVSSAWIKKKGPQYEWFEWQDGYAVFSADYRHLSGIEKYIRRQKDHHNEAENLLSFQDEFMKLLHAFGIDTYQEEYLFPNLPPSHNLLSEPLPQYGLQPSLTRKRRKRRRRLSPATKSRRDVYRIEG
ncbi:MAG: putative transposase [Neolewinella sp.]